MHNVDFITLCYNKPVEFLIIPAHLFGQMHSSEHHTQRANCCHRIHRHHSLERERAVVLPLFSTAADNIRAALQRLQIVLPIALGRWVDLSNMLSLSKQPLKNDGPDD